MPQCLEMLRTNDGGHLAIWNALALCHISHVRCGG